MIRLPYKSPVPVVVKRIAAIDLGTNSFHLLIVDIHSDGSFQKVDDLKEMVQLAKKGLGKKLTEAAMKRGYKALQNFKILCESYHVEDILAFATSAIREAENGGDFIQRCADGLGIKVRAIPGRVEAEMIGHAIQHGIKLGKNPVLMVDIGGGSVEFIIGNEKEFFFVASRKIGVSRINDMFKPGDPITKQEIKNLEDYYRKKLAPVAGAFALHRADTIIGSSGTMQNVANIISVRKGLAAEVTLNEFEYTAGDFFAFYEEFIVLNRKQRTKVKGIDSKRVDFINPGVILLNVLLRDFGIKKIKTSVQALREGIIIHYIKKELDEIIWSGKMANPRERSVFELLRKCRWHEAHSRHTAALALMLFDALQQELNLTQEDRELLNYAAFLHDIGYYISHTSHHKHALYLIRNSELKGFKEEEIEIMAHVSRYHRKSLPKKTHLEYQRLAPPVKKRIRKLAAILRVADGLDRSHYQNVERLKVRLSEKELIVEIFAADEANLELWGAKRKSDLLQAVTGRKVNIVHA